MSRPGILILTAAGQPRVVLGEVGRGREERSVAVIGPLPPDEDGTVRLTHVRVGLAEGDRPMLAADPGQAEEPRVLLVLNAAGGWRGSVGYKLPEGARELARGTIAQGDAGRAGGWDELLVVVPAPSEVEYRTSGGGGHEGGTRWLRVLADGNVVDENRDQRSERLAREAAEAGRITWL
jgi:hypothetical protein